MRPLIWLSGVGFAGCLAIVADTLIPGMPRLPEWFMVLLFLGILPPLVVMIWRAKVYEDGMSIGEYFDGLPPLLQLGVPAVIAIALANFALLFVLLPNGSPELENGVYQLNNHGQITVVSKEEYIRVMKLERRGIIGHAAAGYAVAGSVLMVMRRRAMPPEM